MLLNEPTTAQVATTAIPTASVTTTAAARSLSDEGTVVNFGGIARRVPVPVIDLPDPNNRGANPERPPGDGTTSVLPENAPRMLGLTPTAASNTPSAAATATPRATAPQATSTIATRMPTTAQMAQVFPGDDIQFTRLALVPEVLSGLVLPEVRKGVETRMSMLQRLHEEKQERLTQSQEALSGNPVGRAVNSTTQIFGRLERLATGMFR